MTEFPHNDIYLLVYNNIKKYRKVNKMTQKELAKRSGYSYAFIRRIEGPNCKKNFSLQTVFIISYALGIEIKSLFEDDNI